MTDATPGALLDRHAAGPHEASPTLWGFGGYHGGLTLGLLARAIIDATDPAEALPLRSITGQFHRPLRKTFDVAATLLRRGRAMTTATAEATATGRVHVAASAVLAGHVTRHGQRHVPITPPMPDVPAADECEPFALPSEFVPFSVHTELRPADPNRPLAGNERPELTAWLRLTEDDRAPDFPRLVMLMDSLAPSVMAVHTELVVVPTVEFIVTGGDGLATATSPWILLRATTSTAGSDGWVTEHLDAWAPDGRHLGSGRQLRLLLPPA